MTLSATCSDASRAKPEIDTRVLLVIVIFLEPANSAQAALAALGIDYVAFCPGAPERHNYAAAAPDGLAAALGRGEVPDFLERIPLDGTNLSVYRPRH